MASSNDMTGLQDEMERLKKSLETTHSELGSQCTKNEGILKKLADCESCFFLFFFLLLFFFFSSSFLLLFLVCTHLLRNNVFPFIGEIQVVQQEEQLKSLRLREKHSR